MFNFRTWPIWLKTGFLTGIVMTIIFIFLPSEFTNLASAPSYLNWIAIPAFEIFGNLCIFFRVDFISDFQPSEGPWRLILLVTFVTISYFIVFFIIGSLVGVGITCFKKLSKK